MRHEMVQILYKVVQLVLTHSPHGHVSKNVRNCCLHCLHVTRAKPSLYKVTSAKLTNKCTLYYIHVLTADSGAEGNVQLRLRSRPLTAVALITCSSFSGPL